MATEQATETVHGGIHVAKALRSRGVQTLFTLSGGHLFSVYDGCKREDVRIVDVRHEQAAVFAAEGLAKATRTPGVAALTAGPGVTNGMSAMAGASFNGSPVTVLGGRAPSARWGAGSLQEIDHVPFVEPVVKSAATVQDPAKLARMTAEAIDACFAAPTGPTFLDYPLDVVFAEAEVDLPDRPEPDRRPAEGVDEAAERLASAQRPVIMAGTGLYWAQAETQLVELAVARGIPVYVNGLGRGCIPADHDLAFSRSRRAALEGADVALVVGAPLDFRLGFGDSFGDDTTVIRIGSAPNDKGTRDPDMDLVGDVAATLSVLLEGAGEAPDATGEWLGSLGETEREKVEGDKEQLADARSPLHPMRVYAELNQVLDRETIVIGDGGDFVSYAGRMIDTYNPGCWMDPGPYGCLGGGPGQAIGAAVARPDRPICLLLGDGAFGFSGMEFDTMARHGLPIVGVMGNNGIWALEKHPMEALYGYSVAAELEQSPYHRVVEALGCDGVCVSEPDELRPALENAFESGRPTLVNVLTDPEVAYPRSSNLA
ncbi:MAG: acetolactate synthase [Solirubrobacterales bacterium]